MTKPSPRLVRAGALLLAGIALPTAQSAAQDPPGEQVTFQSHGATLHGRFFRAPGAGVHPTVLLLHGYPGNPRDVLGLGEALPAGGWSALAFNYRGAYGSEGRLTPPNSLEDAAAALSFLRARSTFLQVDTGRVAVVGYSYGGWVALMTGDAAGVACVGAIAPGNWGQQVRAMRRDSAFRAAIRASYEGPVRAGDIRGMPWDSAYALLAQLGDDYDSTARAGRLAGKPVLVVGGWRDQGPTIEEYIAPLVRALRAGGNPRVAPVTLDDDHTFRATRAQLQRTVIDWLNTGCLAPAAGAPPRS